MNPANLWDLTPIGASAVDSIHFFGPTGRGFACMDHAANLTKAYQRPALQQYEEKFRFSQCYCLMYVDIC